jgi:hypothetical protein
MQTKKRLISYRKRGICYPTLNHRKNFSICDRLLWSHHPRQRIIED